MPVACSSGNSQLVIGLSALSSASAELAPTIAATSGFVCASMDIEAFMMCSSPTGVRAGVDGAPAAGAAGIGVATATGRGGRAGAGDEVGESVIWVSALAAADGMSCAGRESASLSSAVPASGSLMWAVSSERVPLFIAVGTAVRSTRVR